MYSVLIIDDEKNFAEDAADELRLSDFAVDLALTYTEAMHRLDTKLYDVISLDIMMGIRPNEDIDLEQAAYGKNTGLVIYEHIRRVGLESRVIVCSIIIESVRGRLRPGTIALKKPVTPQEYSDAVTRAAKG